MSTETALKKQPDNAIATAEGERMIEYVPLGETEAIKLSLGMIRKYIARPTRNGVMPTDQDLMQYLMLNKARGLNPWVGDSYLIGYDSQGGATFSLITAIQSLFKRAELNPAFQGMTYGVIVKNGDTVSYLEGDFVPPGMVLLGGWAKVFRSDRSVPIYDALNLGPFDKANQQWKKDPAGMIVKCAQASVLRTAFPSQCGGLYTSDEIERRMTVEGTVVKQETTPAGKVSAVQAALNAPSTTPAAFTVPSQQPTTEPVYREPRHEQTRIIQPEQMEQVEATEEAPVAVAPVEQPQPESAVDAPQEMTKPTVDQVLHLLRGLRSAGAVREFESELAMWSWSDADSDRIKAAMDAKKASFGKK